MVDRKSLIRKYKDTPRTAGVYRVTDAQSDRCIVGSSVDAPAMLNRIRAQLRMGMHPNRPMQEDWNLAGGDGFMFEILDTLPESDEPDYDPGPDLKILEELWLDKLALSSDARY